MLRSGAIQSLRALLVLADAPGRWFSVAELARLQDLPPARLEQLLLRLRRAGVLVARRGRRGGYRLAQPAAELSLAAILAALQSGLPGAALPWSIEAAGSLLLTPAAERSPQAASPGAGGGHAQPAAGERAVAMAAAASQPGPQPPGAEPPQPLQAGARVTSALNRRLQRALERELARTSLEDLLHDLRSARALLSDDGGLVLG